MKMPVKFKILNWKKISGVKKKWEEESEEGKDEDKGEEIKEGYEEEAAAEEVEDIGVVEDERKE